MQGGCKIEKVCPNACQNAAQTGGYQLYGAGSADKYFTAGTARFRGNLSEGEVETLLQCGAGEYVWGANERFITM